MTFLNEYFSINKNETGERNKIMRKLTLLPSTSSGSNISRVNIKTVFRSKSISQLSVVAAAIVLSLYAVPEKASAACNPAPEDGLTTTCDTSSVHATTLGNGPGLNNVTINLEPEALINTAAATAVSLDSNATITLGSQSRVQNFADGTLNGPWGRGANTIEFNNDNTLSLGDHTLVLAEGTTGGTDTDNAVHIMGAGNTILNHGQIISNKSNAIQIDAATGLNTIDNYGSIVAENGGGVAISSSFGDSSVSIINHSPAIIFGSIDLGGGNDSITLESGTTVIGTINGGGGINTLTLEGPAVPIVGSTTIPRNITNFASLTINGQANWFLPGGLTNINNVTINAGGLELAGSNSYAGDTLINGGQLAARAVGTFSPNSAIIIAPAGRIVSNGYNQTIPSVSNAGVINLNGAAALAAGTELTVTGDYVGNNGLLYFTAKLSDDASQSTRLIVEGNTSGDTLVAVSNGGGSGAQTVDGIELISVGGSSDGEFTQSGRIVAGAYDYTLERGTGTNAANWYLNSSTAAPAPGPSPEP
ncbi:autotransporter outer membrane beta-barrel domain-containing protein, partial [Sodalis sp. dw_96]|uniref:autotransporter outer membrane beta-barrel domain-containing protein n=1 Tax=Sodalis sp. dw_96 TaxID=2719794 RepID=UPI001BD4581F